MVNQNSKKKKTKAYRHFLSIGLKFYPLFKKK